MLTDVHSGRGGRGARVAVVMLLGLVTGAGFVLPGPAGQVALYPLLGLFPGMFVARVLAGRATTLARWTLGLTLAPWVSAVAGWALMACARIPLASAALWVGIGGWIGWAALEIGAREPRDSEALGASGSRFLLGWTLITALVIAILLFTRPFLRIHWDGWVHAGLVWEIVHHGIPREDPRMVGVPLYYFWFYHLFVAMLTVLRHGDPFWFMAILNVGDVTAFILLAWQLGWALWQRPDAAGGAVVLTTLGLNAGAWMTWPLILLKALHGEVRGMAEVRRIASLTRLDSCDVIYSLSAPFAHMLSFMDKFLEGTPLSYAWLLFLVFLWSLAVWLREGRRVVLAWALIASSGMMLFHFVVGLAVIPVTLGALVIAALLRSRVAWLPSPSRLSAFMVATLLGALTAAPYTLSMLRGWSGERTGVEHHVLHFGVIMGWTLTTSCAAVAWLALRPMLRAWRERRGEAAILTLMILSLILLAIFVHLTEDNESKFVPLILFALAAFAALDFWPAMREWKRRWGRARVTLALTLLFAVTPALTLYGYVADRSDRTVEALNPAPGEEALYAWIRDRSPEDAVFVDAGARDLIMVKGERRLLAGTTFNAERARLPLGPLEQRRAVMADLYGKGARLDQDGALLRGLGHPVYVVYRPTDFAAGSKPWLALERSALDFRLVYDRDGFRVYELPPGR